MLFDKRLFLKITLEILSNNIMARRLPPLNALRAFESAGRHMSMRKAAAELNVTPAAVSHQVKALEEYLGVPLFRRLNRALLLTSAAQKCLPGLTEGLDRLAEAMERLAGEDRAGIVTVSLPRRSPPNGWFPVSNGSPRHTRIWTCAFRRAWS